MGNKLIVTIIFNRFCKLFCCCSGKFDKKIYQLKMSNELKMLNMVSVFTFFDLRKMQIIDRKSVK